MATQSYASLLIIFFKFSLNLQVLNLKRKTYRYYDMNQDFILMLSL